MEGRIQEAFEARAPQILQNLECVRTQSQGREDAQAAVKGRLREPGPRPPTRHPSARLPVPLPPHRSPCQPSTALSPASPCHSRTARRRLLASPASSLQPRLPLGAPPALRAVHGRPCVHARRTSRFGAAWSRAARGRLVKCGKEGKEDRRQEARGRGRLFPGHALASLPTQERARRAFG